MPIHCNGKNFFQNSRIDILIQITPKSNQLTSTYLFLSITHPTPPKKKFTKFVDSFLFILFAESTQGQKHSGIFGGDDNDGRAN